jgi:hypothetical protein
MVMMADMGVVSSSCLPYYISGEGTEHFEHQDVAPPCETHCQGGYSLPIEQDAFQARGIENYDWLVKVHGDEEKIGVMKVAMYEEGPVSFAFNANCRFMGYAGGVFSACTGLDRANHAVYAFGWGMDTSGEQPVEFIEASNSWGKQWGVDGHFRIHPRCITDVTIPGSIEGNPVNHSVGDVNSSVPRDPDSEYWPWDPLPECPFSNGCVTDLEPEGYYSSNELCVSKQLNGKRIRVAEFDTEKHYDVLYVNGQPFSGTEGDGLDFESLDGLLVGDEGIRFETDYSIVRPGFKICEERECPFENGCVTDMGGDGDYSASEFCISTELNGKRIRVVEFFTELDYDFLYVNGQGYSGTEGAGLDLESLNGTLVGDAGISFVSDSSVQFSGFKICAE